jgi:hypothetical protein
MNREEIYNFIEDTFKNRKYNSITRRKLKKIVSEILIEYLNDFNEIMEFFGYETIDVEPIIRNRVITEKGFEPFSIKNVTLHKMAGNINLRIVTNYKIFNLDTTWLKDDNSYQEKMFEIYKTMLIFDYIYAIKYYSFVKKKIKESRKFKFKELNDFQREEFNYYINNENEIWFNLLSLRERVKKIEKYL